MTDYITDPTYRYFNEVVDTKTPIIPMLSYVNIKRNGTISKELNIIYYNPLQHSLAKIYDTDFAASVFQKLMSFELGVSSRILVGIVRPSKPNILEPWAGDTIEKINFEPFSLYKGILSIIGKNDGLPVVVPQNMEVIGDIIPGVKQNLNGKNPTVIRQEIKKFENLQNRITEIIADNPFKTVPSYTYTHEPRFNENLQGLNDKQVARLKKLSQL